MFKNVSGQKLSVFAFDSTTNLPKTGDAANLTAYASKDDGSVTVLTDTSATEQSSANAPGYYLFDLSQSETNADKIMFSCVSVTGDIVVLAVPGVVYTTPPLFSTLSINASGKTSPADGSIAAATFAAGAIDNAAIASNAIGAAEIASGAITTATFAAGAINAAAIGTGAIDADALATDAVNEIVDATWDEALAGHTTAGTAGKALSDAGAGGDPWATALPGTYIAGQAGFIVGTFLDEAISDAETAILAAIPSANANADALLDRSAGVETNRTPRQALRLILSALAGKLSGAGTTTVLIRDTNDTKNRITATVDSLGNRTAITYDQS